MSATFLKCLTDLTELPEGDKPHVAIVGRSNVGKSSLVNHLTEQKSLARVSAKPGRTQTLNLYEIDRRYYLVDLPGYGYAKTSKTKLAGFADMIGDYLVQTRQLKLVLLIIDAFVGPTDLDREMFSFLQSSNIPVVIVTNKIDKLSPAQLTGLPQVLANSFSDTPSVPHSVLTNKGRGEIWETIERAVRKS